MHTGTGQGHTGRHRLQRQRSALLLAVLSLAMMIPATARAAQTRPAPAPVQVFAEADPVTRKSRLFMYYLLDNTSFEPSVFTTRIAGINDDPSTMLTVWGANCDLATLGAVRVALEPKPGLPSDPDDPRAF